MPVYKAYIFKRRNTGEREEVRIKVFDSEDVPIALGGSGGLPEGGEVGDVVTNIGPNEGEWAPVALAAPYALFSDTTSLDTTGTSRLILLTDALASETFGDWGFQDGSLIVPEDGMYSISGHLQADQVTPGQSLKVVVWAGEAVAELGGYSEIDSNNVFRFSGYQFAQASLGTNVFEVRLKRSPNWDIEVINLSLWLNVVQVSRPQ